MNDRYGLGGLANDQLLASLSALVARENDALSDMLAHLAELDERGLCLELGYSSLFKYCVDALGFCESSAGRRIAAARVCRKYPEAFARVAKGELKLSVLVILNKFLSAQNAAELFAACSRKSYEQVELLLATRFPQPDVRDLVRRLPTRTRTREATPHIGCTAEPPELGVDVGSEISIPAPLQQVERARGGAVKPLSPERFSVNFTADTEFRELLEEVRALVSHAEPKGDLMSVMKRGLKALKAEVLKKRYGVGRKPRRAGSNLDGVLIVRTRHVAADVKRVVWARDSAQCTFRSAGGRRCSERHLLQLDHVHPYAVGGEGSPSNLRLRCRSHNLHSARVFFGVKFMRASLRRSRAAARRCAADSHGAAARGLGAQRREIAAARDSGPWQREI